MTRPDSLDRRLRRLTERAAFVALWGWILLSSLFFPAWLGYPLVGLALAGVVFLVGWQAARAASHPVYTVGTRREVDVEAITDPRCRCDECGRRARDGERRRYTTRRILFGTTIAVPEWGVNEYCPACVGDERLEESVDPHERTRALERERA
ncbi:hypothetical protein [Natronobiforma cellulositropha]|uniref:hypothetical protein n=1 Tax=Natronobiforma cellulositropha TaxID=1679076 RepID=UPI0021D60C4B|nr:hypothetical protein [Natronobiforma cellulositropha]